MKVYHWLQSLQPNPSHFPQTFYCPYPPFTLTFVILQCIRMTSANFVCLTTLKWIHHNVRCPQLPHNFAAITPDPTICDPFSKACYPTDAHCPSQLILSPSMRFYGYYDLSFISFWNTKHLQDSNHNHISSLSPLFSNLHRHRGFCIFYPSQPCTLFCQLRPSNLHYPLYSRDFHSLIPSTLDFPRILKFLAHFPLYPYTLQCTLTPPTHTHVIQLSCSF